MVSRHAYCTPLRLQVNKPFEAVFTRASPMSLAGRTPEPQACKSLIAKVGQVSDLPFSGPSNIRHRLLPPAFFQRAESVFMCVHL